MEKEQIANVLTLVDVGLSLVEALLPIVSSLQVSGEVTLEQQKALMDRYNSLKGRTKGQFTGPEWEVTDTPVA